MIQPSCRFIICFEQHAYAGSSGRPHTKLPFYIYAEELLKYLSGLLATSDHITSGEFVSYQQEGYF